MRYLFLHAWKGTLVLLLLVTDVQAQVRKDYIVTLAGDTIPFKTHFIRNSWKLFGDKNGRDTMFRAKDLRAFNAEGTDYETFRRKRNKVFYEVVIRDYLSLYTYREAQSSTVKNGGGAYENRIMDITHLRKKTDTPDIVYKVGPGLTWRKKFLKVAGDCPAVVERLKQKGSMAEHGKQAEFVKLYNERCAPKN